MQIRGPEGDRGAWMVKLRDQLEIQCGEKAGGATVSAVLRLAHGIRWQVGNGVTAQPKASIS
jgi:hypothetical protein